MLVVLVCEPSQICAVSVDVTHNDVRMLNSVEHGGLYRSVVVHVLEGEPVADFEWLAEVASRP